MTIKELVEIVLLLGGFGMTFGGAVSAAASGTTAARRSKLTGDVMEQTMVQLQKSLDSLQARYDSYIKLADAKMITLDQDLSTTRREGDKLRELVESMSEQKLKDEGAISALKALAKSLGASEAQIRLASAGILVTATELKENPDLQRSIDLLAGKLETVKTIISEGK